MYAVLHTITTICDFIAILFCASATVPVFVSRFVAFARIWRVFQIDWTKWNKNFLCEFVDNGWGLNLSIYRALCYYSLKCNYRFSLFSGTAVYFRRTIKTVKYINKSNRCPREPIYKFPISTDFWYQRNNFCTVKKNCSLFYYKINT